ncbi:MAG: Hpt domain-containing protein, partial [Zetaproteobacteria bacterium]|nr:Hpt domain-containing protein [Zetaproteobacteria bacterium]
MDEMDLELLEEFILESSELLEDIEQQLLTLEANPGDSELLNAVFRAVHTIKGTCGFLSFDRLEALSHSAENLLGKIRSTGFKVDGELVSLLLSGMDAIKQMVAYIGEHHKEPEQDHSALVKRLAVATRLIDAMVQSGHTEMPPTAPSATASSPSNTAVAASAAPEAAAQEAAAQEAAAQEAAAQEAAAQEAAAQEAAAQEAAAQEAAAQEAAAQEAAAQEAAAQEAAAQEAAAQEAAAQEAAA